MSDKLKEKIERSISDFEAELEIINDGKSVSEEIYLSQLSRGQKAVTDANTSASIDERINLLVEGLNQVIDIAGNKAEKVKRGVSDINIKIAVLREQLLAVEEEDDDDSAGSEETPTDISVEEKKN